VDSPKYDVVAKNMRKYLLIEIFSLSLRRIKYLIKNTKKDEKGNSSGELSFSGV
jgi:hypothetical protein